MSVLDIERVGLAETRLNESLPVVSSMDEIRWAMGTLLTEIAAFVVLPDEEVARQFSATKDPGLAALESALGDVAPEYDWCSRGLATFHGGNSRDEGFRSTPISPWSEVAIRYLHTPREQGDFKATFTSVPGTLTKRELQELTSGVDEGFVDLSDFQSVEFAGQLGGRILYNALPSGAKQLSRIETLSDYRVTYGHAFDGLKK